MSTFHEYILLFFNNLEIHEDLHNHKTHKHEIRESAKIFLKSATSDAAYKVYEAFFKAYWIGTQENENPFLKLTENMKQFEEFAGKLTHKQRDHYVHSVFVFLLGLAIYEQNNNYKNSFAAYALNKKSYPDHYKTKNEEFFYRWGLASLFHDIAYPLEITLKQATLYAEFICSYPEKIDKNLKIKMELCNFDAFIEFAIIEPNSLHKDNFVKDYPDYKNKFHSDAIAIFSESITNNFKLNFNDVNKNIKSFVKNMEDESFIDHGFYSAVIMLRWYHHLVQSTNWLPSYFYYPIADAATAIFLHNYFEHGLRIKFNLEHLEVNTHPIAYLLILCDHLQEWERKCYGKESRETECPIDFKLLIDDSILEIKYKYSNECTKPDFLEIQNKIYELLSVYDIFESGIFVRRMED